MVKKYPLLLKYLQAFKHCHEVLKEAGFDMANNNLRDLYMEELIQRKQADSLVHKTLLGWKMHQRIEVERMILLLIK